MTTVLLFVNFALLVVAVAFLFILVKKSSRSDALVLSAKLEAFEKVQERTERSLKEEVARSRDESGKAARDQRQELAGVFKTFSDSTAQRMIEADNAQNKQIDGFYVQLSSFAKTNNEQLDVVRAEYATASKQLREEVVSMLISISETMTTTMGEMARAQKSQLESMEGRLRSMQEDNTRQLDQMRQTVEEKLQGTLEKRLGESFRHVSECLEQVHKGLGEMHTLASGVGDLKKVLTNVKTRGTWGEVQLGALLEQGLNPDQYAVNVATKSSSGERVEFAIRLPGHGEDKDEAVWLPVDAKFPIEDYYRLVDAQERSDLNEVEVAGRHFENRVRSCAREINEKHLNPPKTTDFGIMFLPVEGLYAEVIRRIGLADFIQREYRVVVAGPTTLWAILNSLQMGFRTLAIQKRSSEVWNLLAAVKAEWTKYGDILDQVQKKLNQASETVEKAKARSKMVGKKLRDVQELPYGEATSLLSLDVLEDGEEET